MYDDLRCKYPLPVEGANDLSYQTKDLDCLLDKYEIREDGTLWHEAYDARMEENSEAFFGFYICHDNVRWEPVDLTGEVRFYELLLDPGQDINDHTRESGWIEWSAHFVKGKVSHLHLIRHELPRAADAVAKGDEVL